MKTKRRRGSPSGTEQHYRSLLAELARSGQSVKEFAKQHSVSPWTLYTWRSRLGLARPRTARPAVAERATKRASRLVEVAVAEPASGEESGGSGLVLYVHGRHRLELPSDLAEDELRRVLRALSSC